MANQFVVQLKNEPGSMANLAEALAARGVDLRAIGGGGIGGAGHVIMTTADDDTTKAVLEEGGYTFIEGESILTEVDDKPGGMAALSRQRADAISIAYGWAWLGRSHDRRGASRPLRAPRRGRLEDVRAATSPRHDVVHTRWTDRRIRIRVVRGDSHSVR